VGIGVKTCWVSGQIVCALDAVLAVMVTRIVNMLPTPWHDQAGRREC